MAFVTVDEAALRLGLSPATVRRRLGAGKLTGKKIGRDWQVDEGALPAAGSIAPTGANSEFTDDELRRAVRHISGTDLTELWVPDILRWGDYLSAQEDLIAHVRQRIETGLTSPATEVRIPKNALASRAGTLIDLIDRVIYQAAVARVAPGVDGATSPRVFSSRLGGDERYFLLRSGDQYVKWQDAALNRVRERNGLLVSTDLSSYFDLVDQPTLLHELGEWTSETYAIETLRRQLRTWSTLLHRGIPQGPNASRLLGNAYLIPVDNFMLEQGYDYWRYMDDVAIVVSSHAEAARAIAHFERACHRRGLLVSSAKTTVQTLTELETESGNTMKRDADYLLHAGSTRARKILMGIFNSAVPSNGKIDISSAKLSLWRLAQGLDRGPLRRMLDRLSDLGPIASVSAAYLRHFLTARRTIEAVGGFLGDPERNTFDYLESWIFAAILEHPTRPPDSWMSRARVVATNRNAAPSKWKSE